MVPGFARPIQLLRGEVDRFRRLAVYVCAGYSAYRQRGYECGCCEVIVVRICSSSHIFIVFGVYPNLDVSEKSFESFLMAMAKLQSVDRNASFFICWQRE